MAIILNIETATTICSVALGVDGKLIALKEIDQGYSHSEQLVNLIDQVFKIAHIHPSALDAVSVSKGPGSYTGLRIGVSLAKGICYGADIPLISIPTLQSLAVHPKVIDFGNHIRVPMLDARRIEVYCNAWDQNDVMITPTQAKVIDSNSFSGYLEAGPTVFFGPGMPKCRDILPVHKNAFFVNHIWPSAGQMTCLSEEKFKSGEFETLSSFEPFYLKDFIPKNTKIVK